MASSGSPQLNAADIQRIQAEALEFAGIGLYRYTLDGTMLSMDRNAFELFDLDQIHSGLSEVLGMNISDLVITQEPRGRLRALIREQHRVRGFEFRFTTLAGNEKWSLHDCYLVTNPQTHEESIQVIARDITERKRAEEALRQSEENYRSIFNAATDAIFVHDMETGEILDANEKTCEMYGYRYEELRGMHVEAISPRCPSYSEAEAMRRIRMAVEGEPQLFEWMGRPKEGDDFHVEVSLKRASIGGVDRILAMVRDISSRKKAEAEHTELEAQLRQAQKMQALGQLAGGIAHDINNLLTAILGNADMSLNLLEKNPCSCAHHVTNGLDEIRSASHQAAGLTRQLLAFSRKQVTKPAIVSPNAAILNLENILRRLIGEHITLRTVCPADVQSVRIDASQLEQVIINLAVNARDAMLRGGDLTVATENITLDDRAIRHLPDARPGTYVLITVQDTGLGMDDETMTHIFEPFFTTKPVGQGTGLGLATVYGIVTQADGHIAVESQPGRGTRFKIFLPATEPAPAVSPAPIEELHTTGEATILICEDEDLVRRLASRILEANGYHVLEAQNAEQALQQSEESERPVDLLITDVIMPGMNGRELAEALTAEDSTLKVLFVSGYTSDLIAPHGVLADDLEFLEKPFTPDDLLNRVHHILERKDPAG